MKKSSGYTAKPFKKTEKHMWSAIKSSSSIALHWFDNLWNSLRSTSLRQWIALRQRRFFWQYLWQHQNFGTISQSVITLLADCLRYFGAVLLHVTWQIFKLFFHDNFVTSLWKLSADLRFLNGLSTRHLPQSYFFLAKALIAQGELF